MRTLPTSGFAIEPIPLRNGSGRSEIGAEYSIGALC